MFYCWGNDGCHAATFKACSQVHCCGCAFRQKLWNVSKRLCLGSALCRSNSSLPSGCKPLLTDMELWQLVWHQEANNHRCVCMKGQLLLGASQWATHPWSLNNIITSDSTPVYSWTWPITMYTSLTLWNTCTRSCASHVCFWIPASLWSC